MDIYVDATTLIALGQVGELELLTVFDGGVSILGGVRYEVTTEPAQSNLERLLSSDKRLAQRAHGQYVSKAQDVLGEPEETGDVWILAAVLSHRDSNEPVAVVSDDRRVRTVARGLGATVTGTIGVVVRNVADGELTVEEAKALVRRLDSHGLHMTGELREKADELIDEAAEASEE
jgi:predicted nucleic acid-binding protein